MQAALFGNPNTGKTSLFNQLTGSYEYVGNWSGVTIEKKVGTVKQSEKQLVDLPGIYSLHPLTKDEEVAAHFLLSEPEHQILNIVNANQLARSLQLTIELLETGNPLAVILNMSDLAEKKGLNINLDVLENKLGVKAFKTIARKGMGSQPILHYIGSEDFTKHSSFSLDYGFNIENAISIISESLNDFEPAFSRWVAIQYLSSNHVVTQYVEERLSIAPTIKHEAEVALHEAQGKKRSVEDAIYETRERFIDDLINEACSVNTISSAPTLTDWIDRFATNRFLGIPLFLGLLFLVFKLTFDWLGTPLSDLLDAFFSGPLTNTVTTLFKTFHVVPFIQDVVIHGIIAGVGGVLVFVPQIFILFFFISLLEDSGYMARFAMVMDRLMEGIGLNGKAFIPLVIGFGCNVPGIMAARTIEEPKERLLTILVTPLMSCSARLSVYSLFVAAFFKTNQALIVLSLYVLGIVIAIIVAKVFTLIVKSEPSYFVIELPPYNVPQLKQLLQSTWDKGKGFVRKAGTFIFGGTIVIWLLSYIGPGGMDVQVDQSFLAIISGFIAPLFAPLGFGIWQAGAALITGFLAKEVVVSTMNIIYFVPNTHSLQGLLPHYFSPLAAYSFLVFILLYVPCLSTVAIIQKETGSKKWTTISIVYALVVAYLVAFIIYRGGLLFGLH